MLIKMEDVILSFLKLPNGPQVKISMSGLDGDYQISMVVYNYIHESFKLRK